MITAPPPPAIRLSLAVTGHRESNLTFTAHRADVAVALSEVFAQIDANIAAEPAGPCTLAPTRLHCLLTDGVDLMAAGDAVARGWELVVPLPFGHDFNVAINAEPETVADMEALLVGGEATDSATHGRAQAIRALTGQARRFELAERDDVIAALYRAKLAAPADIGKAQAFAARASERVALAARVMIEQSDILIAVWDGATHSFVGGTGHTILAALELGAAVIRINPAEPHNWHILRAPEALAAPAHTVTEDRQTALAELVRSALRHDGDNTGITLLNAETWHKRSSRWWTGYRRIEALFGGSRPFRSMRQSYETPEGIATGSSAAMLAIAQALPGGDVSLETNINKEVLQRFAWADGISARLSDSYRGGMIANFLLSALAVVTGIAYQPLASSNEKWMFASVEFVFLAAILVITWLGGRWRWHGRWFETRRVAEYLRHAPILLLLGVARAPGRWPTGSDTSWPEYYARHALRGLGLPRVVITPAYLRLALEKLLDEHVVRQRDYHQHKAKKLTTVHHNLDGFSARLFQLAVVSVSIYLVLAAITAFGMMTHEALHAASKYFTFLGVLLPTFGAAIAGMRYFGDFERFAAISEVTAEKLDGVHSRIRLLLSAPDAALDYARVSELAHLTDEIVVSEIENWQAVFGGKHITVPV